jgi:hypothetical protein
MPSEALPLQAAKDSPPGGRSVVNIVVAGREVPGQSAVMR